MSDNTERLKVCRRCDLNLAESEFSKDRSRQDGLNAICKTCDSVRLRLRYLANPERTWAKARRWAAANRERRNALSAAQMRRSRAGVPPREPLYLAEMAAD